ncbi:Six-bladed beta-propeller, TolB-like,SMP-30/Gluconolactonase/LRE-like region,Senescence marker [Cinara cedri]|uniref:Six-bladed beta-propeller, TolB-like,SMP-30/Gluconolactonase/LRE-like region,Senescence marker n=1 Tax=Cinara cedri TaxID=506608 RepID=A0A5E4N7C5_9HEMI|nr:Six-bladed beta-propeller, TolB-like,SMP-30/Gluconolactonase/LRE-like region,Senescence marker [Cinara cedri]
MSSVTMSAFTCNVLLSLVAATFAYVNYNGISIRQVADDVMVHGEGPFWDSENNVLYFVDIAQRRVYRLVQKSLEYVQLNGEVGFVIPVAGRQGLFVVGIGTELSGLRWNLNETTCNVIGLATVDAEKTGNRWNDAKADNDGHLWAGTMGFEDASGYIPLGSGTLYKLNDTTCFQNLEPALPNVTVSNGMAWNNDSTRMYYTDSPTRQISVFDYNSTVASISNRRVFYDFKTDNIPGVPDGMTIDTDGNLWIANYNGGQVLHVSGTTGKLLGKLKIAAKKVSSVTFGGPKLNKLYVTTISRGVTAEKFKKYPMTGKVLEVSGLGVRGMPNRRVRNKCFLTI